MKRIVDWLIGIEREAGVFYRSAAEKFIEDRELSGFALRLAEEEDIHCALMKSAADYLAGREQVSALTLDDGTKAKIETPLRENKKRLAEKSYSDTDFCNAVVEMEYSEWNHVFLYVVGALKEMDKRFLSAAAKIQQHLQGIEEFFSRRPECRDHLGSIRRLPPAWQGRILVVEDDGLVSEFLRVALEELGIVDVAWNGEEALKKMGDTHYDVIICEVVMPKMDGVELFKTATAREPETRDRFLFLTGSVSDTRFSFLKENKLVHILKPAPVGKIKRSVRDIMMRSAKS